MSSPAANRNKVPIGEALQKYLNQAQTSRTSEHPRLLEIASGCGTHALYFSKLFEHVQWQPSDFQDECLASIQAHLSVDPRPNVDPPLKIDVCDPFDRWGLKHDQYDFVFNANMIHISPWRCTESIFANAGVVLRPGGLLFLYGPFAIDGVLEPKSNQEFNNSLMLNNPEWGIRDLRLVEAEASRSDITLLEVIDMPANNKLVVWKLAHDQ